jgi:hypothetical protein
MAYFSNGSEGDWFREQWCERCVNWREDEPDNWGCPIIDLHMMGNYVQCEDTESGKFWARVLSAFIPRKDDGYNDKCRMFIETPDADIPGQMKMFEVQEKPI